VENGPPVRHARVSCLIQYLSTTNSLGCDSGVGERPFCNATEPWEFTIHFPVVALSILAASKGGAADQITRLVGAPLREEQINVNKALFLEALPIYGWGRNIYDDILKSSL